MRRETSVVAILSFVALLNSTGPARPEAARQIEGQTRFSLEEPVNHPIPIPEDVLKILRREADITACEISPEERSRIPPSWFEASWVQLDGPREEDLVVKAKNACMWGPNLGPFWVFRSSRNGHCLVLSTVAVSLQVLKSSSNGLRDIRTAAIVSQEPAYSDYRFDGHTYHLVDSKR
jgi:hypothetical protein